MFQSLGRFVLRFKFAVVAAWVLAAIWMVTQAPKLSEVAVTAEAEFLPTDAPSMQAQEALAQAFPSEAVAGSATIVLTRNGGLTEADNTYARSFSEWLASPGAPAVIKDVTSVFSQPGTESLLLSPDKNTMLVQAGFTSGPVDEATTEAISALRERLQTNPPPAGLSVHVTGSSAISADQATAVLQGVDRTTAATIILVIIVLLLIYRSPVAALTPLITIGLAYVVSRGVLGYLAVAGVKISSFLDAFAIVLIFGVGTDYCLFILSRFREELGRRADRNESTVATMGAIGAVIAASASTVIVALLFMYTARFGMIKTMGPALALSIFITLLAGLTLTPALVAIVGRYLFWPRHNGVAVAGGRNWHRVADFVSNNHAAVAIVTLVLLLIPYLALTQLRQGFDVLKEMPATTDSVQGFNDLAAHFDAGELLPLTVLLTDGDKSIFDRIENVQQVTEALEANPDVKRVRTLVQPTGDEATADMFHADSQVRQAAQGMSEMVTTLSDPQKALAGTGGAGQTAGLDTLHTFVADLGKLPGMAGRPAYTAVVSRTTALDTALARLGQLSLLSSQLQNLSTQFAQTSVALSATTSLTTTAVTTTSMAAMSSQLKDLQSYLIQLGQAQPTLAGEPGYQDALQAAAALGSDMAKVQELTLVTSQLGLVAQQLQQLSGALQTPMGLLALSGGGAQQLQALSAYLQDLGKAYPTAAGEPAYRDSFTRLLAIQAAGAQLQAPGADLNAGRLALKQEVDGLAADLAALRQWFSSQSPQAVFTSPSLQSLAGDQSDIMAAPAKNARRLADDFATLAGVAKAKLPTARFTPTGIELSPEIKQTLAALGQDAAALQKALNTLADELSKEKPIHFMSSAVLSDARMKGLITYFVSADQKSTRLTVILSAPPYSNEQKQQVRALEPVIKKAAAAAGFTARVGGPPVVLTDIQDVVTSDFVRIALFTILGVLIVLILLLRSLVAPIYLILTVLLSFGSTLGLSTIIFQDMLGQYGVNYMIPIIVFVLLVALGADYNIFLMSRVREEAHGRTTREGIRIASAFTGAIITSCGIILAGTFAAMMLAPVQLLFQVGLAVAVGVLLDTFVIRAILVPAIASILGERNWWPSRLRGSPAAGPVGAGATPEGDQVPKGSAQGN